MLFLTRMLGPERKTKVVQRVREMPGRLLPVDVKRRACHIKLSVLNIARGGTKAVLHHASGPLQRVYVLSRTLLQKR